MILEGLQFVIVALLVLCDGWNTWHSANKMMHHTTD